MAGGRRAAAGSLLLLWSWAICWHDAEGVKLTWKAPQEEAADGRHPLFGWHVRARPDASEDESRGSALLEHMYKEENNAWTDQAPTVTMGRENVQAKTIFYNGNFGACPEGMLQRCSAPCRLTRDPRELPNASLVVYNEAGRLVYRGLPSVKAPGQRWVFSFYFEPPNRNLDFEVWKRRETAAVESSGFIDWTMTYSPLSDFLHPSAKLVPLSTNRSAKLADVAPPMTWRVRPKILLSLVSNCEGPRLMVLKRLQDLLPKGSVDIFGFCGKPSPCQGRDESDACHQRLFAQYRFYAAFENRRIRGYISEKLFRGLLEGMVPLALGGLGRGDYEAIGVPRDAMLHVDDFKSVQEMADHLNRSKDDSDYGRYFAWRREFRVATTMETRMDAFCEICKEVHKPESEQRPSRTFGTNLTSWWFDQLEGLYHFENGEWRYWLDRKRNASDAAKIARDLGPSLQATLWR